MEFPTSSGPPSVHMYLDATGSFGCGAVVPNGAWFNISWSPSDHKSILEPRSFYYWSLHQQYGALFGLGTMCSFTWITWQLSVLSTISMPPTIFCVSSCTALFLRSALPIYFLLHTHCTSTQRQMHYHVVTWVFFSLFNNRYHYTWFHHHSTTPFFHGSQSGTLPLWWHSSELRCWRHRPNHSEQLPFWSFVFPILLSAQQPPLFPLSESTICHFVAHLFNDHLTIGMHTIRLYLSSQ